MASVPPAYVPDPAGRPVRSPTAKVVVIIVGILLLCFVSLAGLAYIGMTYGKARHKVGWNGRLVGVPIKGKWATYHISLMELSIACFQEPQPDTQIEQRMGKRYDVSEYLSYRLENSQFRGRITQYWYANSSQPWNSESGLDRLANYYLATVQKHFPSFTESRVSRRAVSGEDIRDIRVTFPFKKQSWTSRTVLFSRHNTVTYFTATYWNAKNRWGERSFDYMVKSLRFDSLPHR